MRCWVVCVLCLAVCAAPGRGQESALERFERLRGAGQSEAASADLDRWVEGNPGDLPAAMALGRYYSDTGQGARALEVWRRALEKAGDEASFAGVANQLVGAGETASAVEVLELGRRKLKDVRLFSLQLAELHLRQRVLKPAVREYLAYLDLQPHRLGQVVHRLRGTGADATQTAGLLAALEAEYRRRADRNSAVLYSYVCVAAGLPERGLEALRAGLADPEIAEALFQFAARCEAEKHGRVAATAYGLFVDAVPQSPYRHQALLRQGELEARFGGREAASAVYLRLAAEAPQRPEAIEALLELADLTLTQRGDLEGARQALEQVLKVRPRGPSADRARLLLCETSLRQGDLDEAAGHLEYVVGQAHTAEALFRQAEVDFFAGEYEASRQGLEQFAHQAPRDGRANDALDLLLLLEEHADAGEALRAYADARLATRAGADDANAAWERLKAVAPAPLRLRAAWERARRAEAAGDPAALKLYGALEGDYAVEGHMGRARLLEERGDLDGALEAYETALLHFADDPRGPLVRLHIQRLRPLVPDAGGEKP